MTDVELLEKVKLKLDRLGQFAPVFTPVLSTDGNQISFIAGRVIGGVLCQAIETWTAEELGEAGNIDSEVQAGGELIAFAKCFPALSEQGWRVFAESQVVEVPPAIPPATTPAVVAPKKSELPLAEVEVSLRRSMAAINSRLGRGDSTNAAFKTKLLEYGVKGKEDYSVLTKVQLAEFQAWAIGVEATPVEGVKKPVPDFDPMIRRKIVQASPDTALESQIIVAYSDASDQLRAEYDKIVMGTGFSAGNPNSESVLTSTWDQMQRALSAN